MNPRHIPRESPPSIPLVLITLMVMVGASFGAVLVAIRVVDWWRGRGL